MAVVRPSLVVLDVGHGSATIACCHDATVVVDTGRAADLLEFLEGEGIEHVDLILVSHADADHLGGLVGLLAAGVSVSRVVLNGDALKETQVWGDVLFELQSRHEGTEVAFEVGLSRGREAFRFGELTLDVIAPTQELAARGVGGHTVDGGLIRSNTLSAVIRVSFSGRPIAVLPGDLDALGLSEFQRWGSADELAADVLVYPHHGGKSGRSDERLAEELATAVNPGLVAFSIGRGRHGTPRPEIVMALRNLLPAARVACTELSTACAGTIDTPVVGHLAPVHARGRVTTSCCAGSIVLPLRDAVEGAVPDRGSHTAFIDAYAPNALCRP